MQTQSLQENKNIYYVCVNQGDDLVPWLYKCRAGEVYTAKNQTCVQSEEYAHIGCVGAGKMADPHDGTKYYDCVNGKPNHFSCADGSYFNQERERCVSINEVLNAYY